MHGDPTGWPAACESLTDPGAVPDGLRARACVVPDRYMCLWTGSLAQRKPNRVSLDAEDNLACCSGSPWECWSRNTSEKKKESRTRPLHRILCNLYTLGIRKVGEKEIFSQCFVTKGHCRGNNKLTRSSLVATAAVNLG